MFKKVQYHTMRNSGIQISNIYMNKTLFSVSFIYLCDLPFGPGRPLPASPTAPLNPGPRGPGGPGSPTTPGNPIPGSPFGPAYPFLPLFPLAPVRFEILVY